MGESMVVVGVNQGRVAAEGVHTAEVAGFG
jgi:hypothetical protein